MFWGAFLSLLASEMAYREERKEETGRDRKGGKGRGDWELRAPRLGNTHLTKPKCLLTILLDSPLPLLSIYGPPVYGSFDITRRREETMGCWRTGKGRKLPYLRGSGRRQTEAKKEDGGKEMAQGRFRGKREGEKEKGTDWQQEGKSLGTKGRCGKEEWR